MPYRRKRRRIAANVTLPLFAMSFALFRSLSAFVRTESRRRIRNGAFIPDFPNRRSFSNSVQAFLEETKSMRQEETSTAFTTAKQTATSTPLMPSRTAIHRMRKPELEEQLELRNMNTTGLKKDLVSRLLGLLENQDLGLITSESVDSSKNETANTSTSEISQLDLQQLDPTRTYVLKIKGLSSLHSNSTGIGIVLVDAEDDRDVCTARKVLEGDRSVFEAEYSALIIGLKFALGRGVSRLVLQLDHDVIANQLKGKFPVDRENLKPMYWNIMLIKEEILEEFSVKLVKPKENTEAYNLAQQGLATRKSMNIFEQLEDPMDSSTTGGLPTPKVPPTDPGSPLSPMNYGKVTIDSTKLYRLEFDGGARGNPGCAGAGVVLYDGDVEIWCGWKYLGAMSNNAAEYSSLLIGLQCALSLGVKRIDVRGDSDLIVKQINGVYRVKHKKLKEYYLQITKILPDFDYFELKHFRREFNKRADWLANHAMDTESAHGYEELRSET